ncbi:hypothetical protein Bca4012_035551 [Brassica carinata]
MYFPKLESFVLLSFDYALIDDDLIFYQKGILYDIMGTFKDFNIQVCAYGLNRKNCEIDLFILQSDGR